MDRIEAGFESTDEEECPTSVITPKTTIRTQGDRSRVPDEDLITGKCMTCDCMVRWPKELLVFRCTICLTINDLKPVRMEARRDGYRAPVAAKSGSSPNGMTPALRKHIVVSLQYHSPAFYRQDSTNNRQMH